MAVCLESHKFEVPSKKVTSPGDIVKWENSQAYQDVLGLIISLNNSVRGKSCNSPCEKSEVTVQIIDVLDNIGNWIKEYKPIEQPQRYGNKAFRDFYERLSKDGCDLLTEALGVEYKNCCAEIFLYLQESFGNSTRIDYGTGHELSFIMFLTCLFKIGALKQQDSQAAVTIIFKRYVELARELQTVYKMEPAGSQGVWSLDDYQFIPFIWGSSQLIMNANITPEMLTNPKVAQDNAENNLFMACIQYILKVKNGPFAEHSNQLWNISGVPSWTKVNQGLIKMYKAEVLNKFPVIQHVLFGSILTFETAERIPQLKL